MLCFLGVKVLQTVTNRQKYKQALQEIKHYLSFKSSVEVEESDYLLSVRRGEYFLQIPKHSYYLHSCYYNIPVLHQADFDFLDICYECLMIIREAFPSKLVSDAEGKQLEGFEERKKEEFNRRVNASLKALIQSKSQLTGDDIEDIIYLCAKNYARKNRASALRMLISRINQSNICISAESIEGVERLQQDGDLRKLVIELVTKIKSLSRQAQLNKQNAMRASNLSHQPEPQTLKLKPLIFQLKQSYSIERICLLLASTLSRQNDKMFLQKLETSIVVVTNRFLEDQYEEAAAFGLELSELLKVYWEKRDKKWEQGQREAVDRKLQQFNSNSRFTLSRSKMMTSRKLTT